MRVFDVYISMGNDMFWGFLGFLLWLVWVFYGVLMSVWRADSFADEHCRHASLIRISSFRHRGKHIVRVPVWVPTPDRCRIPISQRRAQIKRFEAMEKDYGLLIANKYRSKYWVFLKKNSG